MKKLVSFLVVASMAIPLFSPVAVQQAAASTTHNYRTEVQTHQFRPHGGDKQEVADFAQALVKHRTNPAELDKLLAKDSLNYYAMQEYVKTLAQFQKIEVVEAVPQKLYTVEKEDAYNSYRSIVKFKYIGYTADNKAIEKTDLIGLVKRGNKDGAVWQAWGTVWQDTGIDVSNVKLFQLEKPRKGEEIVVMTTDAGVIKLRLFPDKAPKAVENFKGLAKKGVYNNMIFHRVINDFMIQAGELTGPDGKELPSIYGKDFADEFNHDLFNFRGALSMGNAGPNTNSTHFYIVQSPNVDQEYLDLSALPLNAEAKYKEIGGRAYLDNRHTVFGQVFEGMEVVDKIAAQKTDENAKPLTNPVKVKKIEFVIYNP
ncbi:peptidylprolyl isomerase [Brevibacillus parabrevis]|uniref:peptidylprolyl isomerase n=1 Tax=Brevibacillus parabrevis TaxID=54914 RepID=A0A4Y3PEE5_BREPA|nr:peptidylprolyl isomerase [Brevibacillus parabrevis]MED2253299.1 peptidylprolyl isomerase [Brevibacillus parabrevis]RNB95470.1 peptidylprolyl isomerase [Brevibacillus parabrevis]GEB31707.1 hypothetical protein BPA01_12870 [Brevibacillus parabrevis]